MAFSARIALIDERGAEFLVSNDETHTPESKRIVD